MAKERKLICKMIFGSHLFGTNTSKSDEDIKAIYMPTAEEILLQKVVGVPPKKQKGKGEKNSPGEEDIETISYQRYLEFLLQGQTNALDMIFAPKEFYLMEPDPAWIQILENKDKFLHSGVSAFAGYCKTQANKYSVKGNRLNAANAIVEFLETKKEKYGKYAKLYEFENELDDLVKEFEFITFVYCTGPKDEDVKHLEVCNRKVPLFNSIKQCEGVYKRVVDQYGKRAAQAAGNLGADWKALSHAVRVSDEARELLTTGKITLPRPNADLLLKIKNGEIKCDKVFDMIDEGLFLLEECQEKSILPSVPDHAFAMKLVKDNYRSVILSEIFEEHLER